MVGRTLGAVLRETVRWGPERPALLAEGRCLTYGELDREVDQVARLLAGMGVRAGDAVGFLLHKRPEVVTGFLACARLGAIMVPINFKWSEDALRTLFRTADIRFLFVEAGHLAVLEALGEAAPPEARRVAVGSGVAGVPYGSHGSCSAEPLELEIDPHSPCYYNYTSGTTGTPKGAITTHHNVLANAVATIDGLGFEASDVFLGMFSVFSHPHELFHRSIVLGGAFVILDSHAPRAVLDAIARYGVRWMMAVPSFYEMMLDYADLRAKDGLPTPDISSLRVLEAGGAYVGAETMARMEERFPGAAFVPVWGSTEATGVAIANGGAARRPGATGRPVPGYTVQVRDEDDRAVGPGEVGELVLQGDALALGYIRNPDETAALFVDGWYHTRDLVRIDEDGYVHFVGRLAEMLKIGGLRVYPLEIEIALRRNEAIRDAVVVGVQDRLRGEMARAVIQRQPGAELDARGVRIWCREQLAAYKIPRVIEFWDDLPRLPNGKVDRKAIAATPHDERAVVG